MKKFYYYITTFILFIVTIFCFTSTSNGAYLYGDVNLDGKLTNEDYELAKGIRNGKVEYIEVQRFLADIDGDSVLDAIDLTYLHRFIQGLAKLEEYFK